MFSLSITITTISIDYNYWQYFKEDGILTTIKVKKDYLIGSYRHQICISMNLHRLQVYRQTFAK